MDNFLYLQPCGTAIPDQIIICKLEPVDHTLLFPDLRRCKKWRWQSESCIWTSVNFDNIWSKQKLGNRHFIKTSFIFLLRNEKSHYESQWLQKDNKSIINLLSIPQTKLLYDFKYQEHRAWISFWKTEKFCFLTVYIHVIAYIPTMFSMDGVIINTHQDGPFLYVFEHKT